MPYHRGPTSPTVNQPMKKSGSGETYLQLAFKTVIYYPRALKNVKCGRVVLDRVDGERVFRPSPTADSYLHPR